jgi:hypothetical protein
MLQRRKPNVEAAVIVNRIKHMALQAKTSSPPSASQTARRLPLLYSNPVVLRFEEHAEKGIKPVQNFRFAAAANAVPLAMGEFMPAVRNYPIVFAEGETPAPVALLGIRQGQNLHVAKDGAWRAGAYLPVYLRRYPFILTEMADKSTRALCIDLASDRFVDAWKHKNWRLFNDDGSAAPIARKMLGLCEAWHQEQLQGADFVTALKDADLLVPQGVTFSFPDGGTYNLGGYRIVDHERLRQLAAETLKDWNERGWLNAIALHLASLHNWQLLHQLAGEEIRKEAE